MVILKTCSLEGLPYTYSLKNPGSVRLKWAIISIISLDCRWVLHTMFFSVIIITKHPDIFWSDLHSPPAHWEPSCGSLQSPSKPPLWRQQPQLLIFNWNLFFFIRNWIKLKVNLYQWPWCLFTEKKFNFVEKFLQKKHIEGSNCDNLTISSQITRFTIRFGLKIDLTRQWTHLNC